MDYGCQARWVGVEFQVAGQAIAMWDMPAAPAAGDLVSFRARGPHDHADKVCDVESPAHAGVWQVASVRHMGGYGRTLGAIVSLIRPPSKDE